jgi:hypothetical protein
LLEQRRQQETTAPPAYLREVEIRARVSCVSTNASFPRDEIVGRIFVDFVTVRTLKAARRLLRRELIGTLPGHRFSAFGGEALAAGFAFHQPG